jgi:quinol monooxygenase YgiN
MSLIKKGADILTLIIVIEVKPENFDALFELIVRETTEFVRHQPGFISANLHRSADSTQLINYGQWENQKIYEQARARDEFKAFSKQVEALAISINPIACDVVFTEERVRAMAARR